MISIFSKKNFFFFIIKVDIFLDIINIFVASTCKFLIFIIIDLSFWVNLLGIYLFKVNNGNTRTICKICSRFFFTCRLGLFEISMMKIFAKMVIGF